MFFNAVLERRAQEGLGIAIKRGRPGEWVANGALVVDLLSTGPAYGKLRPGDVIMSVNGVSLESKSHSEMLELLRRAEGMVTLLVYRQEEMEVSEDAQRAQALATSASCQSLFLPDGLSASPQTSVGEATRRNYSMPGFASPRAPPVHASSLPQLSARSEDQLAPFSREHRQASLLKINLAKQNPQEGLGVELSGQLVITSVTPGGKADHAGIRVGDRVVNLNGIDAAHLSLIDAAYLMRREQSDVTLMRVEHEVEEEEAANEGENASSPSAASRLCSCEALPQCRCPYYITQEPLHIATHPMEYSPVLCRPVCQGHEGDRPSAVVRAPQLCRCHAQPQCCAVRPEVTREKKNSPPFFNSGDESGQDGDSLRLVNIWRHSVMGTGIRIIGGNAVGIFVSEVNSQSPAAETSVRPGDEIISINGEPVKSMTKSEAALRILKSEKVLRLEVRQNLDKYEAFMNDKLGPGDDFYVRAAFNYIPSVVDGNSSRLIDPLVPIPALPIAHGDIFNVTDSLVAGSFASWLARKVSPNISGLGSIPSIEKASQLLKKHRPASVGPLLCRNAKILFPRALQPLSREELRPYLRVSQLDCYPYPRPVIIYGPLADKAMRWLIEDVSTMVDGEGGPRFEVPPISGSPTRPSDAWAPPPCPASPGAIRLSAIQMLMERGKHAVLNLRPSAIEVLLDNGITPIVLLVTATSVQQIRAALEVYRPKCQQGTKELSRRLWTEVTGLRQSIPHLITDTVPLLNSPIQAHFDEAEWMHNLVSIIRHHQSQPVWVAEDSVAFCKANEKVATPKASPGEPPGPTIEESSSERSEKDVRDERNLDSNGGYRGDSSSFGKSSDEWGMPNRLELMEDRTGVRFPKIAAPQSGNELRRVRIQSPRTDSRASRTESPRVQETCIDTVSPRVGDSGEAVHERQAASLSGRRHRSLSWRNAPCGLISEPQSVVAEAIGEFAPEAGGRLQIPQHGVELSIPPGAIPDYGDGGKQEVYLRVYEGEHRGEDTRPGEIRKPHMVSPLVMCGPRGLRFQKPVTLTMPRFHTHHSRGDDGGGPAEGTRSSSPSSSWSLRVMHAATQSDCVTSASEAETRQHALRQWRTVSSPPAAEATLPSSSAGATVTTPTVTTVAAVPTASRPQSGTESDSSGAAIACQVADSFISLLIDHF